jgi:hypothetical protein
VFNEKVPAVWIVRCIKIQKDDFLKGSNEMGELK